MENVAGVSTLTAGKWRCVPDNSSKQDMAKKLDEPNQTQRTKTSANANQEADEAPFPKVAGAFFEVRQALEPRGIQQKMLKDKLDR